MKVCVWKGRNQEERGGLDANFEHGLFKKDICLSDNNFLWDEDIYLEDKLGLNFYQFKSC
mgnify:CR=1